jgi:hypothetical protein
MDWIQVCGYDLGRWDFLVTHYMACFGWAQGQERCKIRYTIRGPDYPSSSTSRLRSSRLLTGMLWEKGIALYFAWMRMEAALSRRDVALPPHPY